MKIADVKIDRFGIWKDLSIEDLSQGLTVFYGPNEAGKTTLLQFARSILYGFSSPSRRRFLPTQPGEGTGGTLGVQLPEGAFRIARSVDLRHGDPNESLAITAAGETVSTDAASLRELLHDVDEGTFTNVFAVGLREMQELGTLSDTDAAQWLYRISSGHDRVPLVDVMRELETSRHRILSDEDAGLSQIPLLLSRRDQLRADVEQAAKSGRHWPELAQRRRELDRRIERLESDREKFEQESSLLQRAISVREVWHRRDAVDRQLRELGPSRTFPDEGVDRLEEIVERIDRHQHRREDLKVEYRRLGNEAKHLGLSDSLWRQGPRIEALSDQLEWISTIEGQIRQPDPLLASHGQHLSAGPQSLTAAETVASTALNATARKAIEYLRSPARSLRSAQQLHSAAEREVKERRTVVDALFGDVRQRFADLPDGDLSQAVDLTGQRVIQLRKRIGLDKRLDQLQRHRGGLEDQSRDLMDQQLLPFGVLVALGTLFIVGVVMMLTGLWFPTSVIGTLGKTLAFLGILGTGTAGAIKFLMERSIDRRLEGCQSQLQLLARQFSQAQEEREQVDLELPSGNGPLVARLQSAEEELAELEELLPLQDRRESGDRELRLAEEKLRAAQAEVANATTAWRTALSETDLPTDLTPKQVRELAAQAGPSVDWDAEATQRQQEIEWRRREYDSVSSRVRQLASDAGVNSESQYAADLLREISRAWSDQKPKIQRRDEIRRHMRDIRDRAKKHARSIRQLSGRRDALLKQAGVGGLSEYRQFALHATRVNQLRQELEALNREIKATIEDADTEAAVGRLFAGESKDLVDRHWEETNQQLSSNRQELEDLLVQRGAVSQEEKELANDRRLAEWQLELSTIETQLARGLESWQAQAATWMVLDSVKKDYETSRQPETLIEASAYLDKLTNGRYKRVWTPVEEDVLYVVDPQGESRSVDMLSRGTREQLFLSLRLALVALYARKGVHLPLVLDDVLVNFDVDRASAAARVLKDFSKKGHQVLLFTCHEHIWSLFKSLRVDVRRLGDTSIRKKPSQSDRSEARQVKRRRKRKVVEKTPPIAAVEVFEAELPAAESPAPETFVEPPVPPPKGDRPQVAKPAEPKPKQRPVVVENRKPVEPAEPPRPAREPEVVGPEVVVAAHSIPVEPAAVRPETTAWESPRWEPIDIPFEHVPPHLAPEDVYVVEPTQAAARPPVYYEARPVEGPPAYYPSHNYDYLEYVARDGERGVEYVPSQPGYVYPPTAYHGPPVAPRYQYFQPIPGHQPLYGHWAQSPPNYVRDPYGRVVGGQPIETPQFVDEPSVDEPLVDERNGWDYQGPLEPQRPVDTEDDSTRRGAEIKERSEEPSSVAELPSDLE